MNTYFFKIKVWSLLWFPFLCLQLVTTFPKGIFFLNEEEATVYPFLNGLSVRGQQVFSVQGHLVYI